MWAPERAPSEAMWETCQLLMPPAHKGPPTLPIEAPVHEKCCSPRHLGSLMTILGNPKAQV